MISLTRYNIAIILAETNRLFNPKRVILPLLLLVKANSLIAKNPFAVRFWENNITIL